MATYRTVSIDLTALGRRFLIWILDHDADAELPSSPGGLATQESEDGRLCLHVFLDAVLC